MTTIKKLSYIRLLLTIKQILLVIYIRLFWILKNSIFYLEKSEEKLRLLMYMTTKLVGGRYKKNQAQYYQELSRIDFEGKLLGVK